VIKKEKNGEFCFHKKRGDPIPEYLWFGDNYVQNSGNCKKRGDALRTTLVLKIGFKISSDKSHYFISSEKSHYFLQFTIQPLARSILIY
jgi:hypothetical protein